MNDDRQTQTSAPRIENGSMIGSVASDIGTAATEKFGQAVSEVRAKANDAKAGVANEVKDVAMVLRRASEDLRGGSAQERTLGTIASSLADVSDSIRDKDLGEIVQMVSKVARENPVMFLGGAALLGFAASRYAKASGSTAPVTSARETQAQVETFVDEGNPNVQSMHPAS